ncbi:uncharacterized protein LOC142538875 [Primulina tabacum]|uniref:uncharacterized protein LOC142538875 n=1 Tax=Primulina tabacum TaxID=48773 RepID=UPI003F5987D4
MYNQNSEHKSLGAPPMSPRISFSIDFVEPSHSHSQSHARDPYRDAPVSSDFAFSVSNYSMMSADELFSKGRILPYKEGCSGNSSQFSRTTTLRDELQNEEEDGDFSARPPKNPTRWRGFLGLRKPHIGSRKSDKYGQGSSVEKRGSFHYEDINVQCSKNSQESVE